MSAPTVEQQLDALVLALRSGKFWIGIGQDDSSKDNMSIYLYEVGNMRQILRVDGTRTECIAQLIAYQAAERLS